MTRVYCRLVAGPVYGQSVNRSVVSSRIHTKSGYECKIKSGEHGNEGEGKTEYAEAERSLNPLRQNLTCTINRALLLADNDEPATE